MMSAGSAAQACARAKKPSKARAAEQVANLTRLMQPTKASDVGQKLTIRRLLLRLTTQKCVAAPHDRFEEHSRVLATHSSSSDGATLREQSEGCCCEQRDAPSSRSSRRDHLTVAVTGASGYVGSYITEELLKRGHDVRALVRGCETNTEKAAHLRALPGAERLTLIDGGDLGVQGLIRKWTGRRRRRRPRRRDRRYREGPVHRERRRRWCGERARPLPASARPSC